MKRYLSLALVLVMVFVSSAGCGGSGGGACLVYWMDWASGGEAQSASSGPALPKMMAWVAYEVGAAGYNQAAAMANGVTQTFGTQIRIIPADTSVGRILNLKTGNGSYGFLADEAYFASHGLYDFAEKAYGPQDLRVLIAKPSCYAFAVTKASGITTFEQLRGKRLSVVPGNTSHIVKGESFLAFGGLTTDDVIETTMASYNAGIKGLMEGKVDVVGVQTTASALYEVDSSPVGLTYLEMDPNDTEGWKRLQAITPWIRPGVESRGAGMNGKDFNLTYYSYPQIVCYANTSADEVYALLKALDETYELYKDMDPQASDWAIDISSGFPNGAPFHEGAVRYLKEKGLWTDAHEQWNQKELASLKAEQEAWQTVLKEAAEQKIGDKDYAAYWLKRRAEILGL
jgi:TRAP transporter TAXI family solute receptor